MTSTLSLDLYKSGFFAKSLFWKSKRLEKTVCTLLYLSQKYGCAFETLIERDLLFFGEWFLKTQTFGNVLRFSRTPRLLFSNEFSEIYCTYATFWFPYKLLSSTIIFRLFYRECQTIILSCIQGRRPSSSSVRRVCTLWASTKQHWQDGLSSEKKPVRAR